jgi:putative Mg2+ transporter-C (MgtC) family protein
MGYYALAIAGCVIVMVTLTFLQKVVKVQAIKNVEVKFVHRLETISFINEYFERMGIQVLDIDFHVENKGEYNLYTNLYTGGSHPEHLMRESAHKPL